MLSYFALSTRNALIEKYRFLKELATGCDVDFCVLASSKEGAFGVKRIFT